MDDVFAYDDGAENEGKYDDPREEFLHYTYHKIINVWWKGDSVDLPNERKSIIAGCPLSYQSVVDYKLSVQKSASIVH